VGGAAAGTAIAWCLSTAGASADTGANTPRPAVPVVGSVHAPLGHAVDAAADSTVGKTADQALDATAAHLSDPPAHAVEQLGTKVRHAAGSFREHATEQLPECGAFCGHAGSDAAPVAGDGTGLGRSDSPAPAPAAAHAATGKVASPGVDPDHTAERTATGRAFLDGMSRRGSPAPGMPSFPGVPTWPAPIAPATPAPASGHTGSTGNPADSALFAALPWHSRTAALVRGLTVPAVEATTFGRVGAQPGVAPD
jgi:hypothetical protein